MTYVNVLHPLFILGWLQAHERLCRPHGRTKVANRLAFAVVLRLRRHQSHSCYQRNYTTYGDIQMENLEGLKVAILVENGFEQVELVDPRRALDQAGAQTQIVSPQNKQVRAWKFTEWGDTMAVDVALDKADPKDFDALLLPGGVMNPDFLRVQPKAVAFVKAFFDASKPVASICHGPWTIIETGAARGAVITSWPSLKTDLRNAGAEWVDKEVVVDGNLVTSRKPDDIPAFNAKVNELFSKARKALPAA
jgi:protease I